MSEKKVGYMLVAIGILLIFISALSVYLVFTKRSKPVELFSFSGMSLDVSQTLTGNLGETAALLEGKPMPKTEIISADMLNDSSNLFAHLFLMGFIASIGLKIATIGTMLLRPIEVKLKEKVV